MLKVCDSIAEDPTDDIKSFEFFSKVKYKQQNIAFIQCLLWLYL